MSKKRHIIQINAGRVTHLHRSFFNPSDAATLRCFAVLNGDTRGMIFTDGLVAPSWVVVYETAFGNLYLGGEVYYPSLRRLFGRLRRSGDISVALVSDDPYWQLLPHRPDHVWKTLDYYERLPHHASQPTPSIPEGCMLQRMDSALMECCAARDVYFSIFGNSRQALQKGFGLCLTRSGNVLSEAFAGPSAHGYYQIGAATHVSHRRKGYATLTCNQLLAQLEQRGYRTYWNCVEGDQASIALARKLGYQPHPEYRMQARFLKGDSIESNYHQYSTSELEGLNDG